jgi:hypothetical protein
MADELSPELKKVLKDIENIPAAEMPELPAMPEWANEVGTAQANTTQSALFSDAPADSPDVFSEKYAASLPPPAQQMTQPAYTGQTQFQVNEVNQSSAPSTAQEMFERLMARIDQLPQEIAIAIANQP